MDMFDRAAVERHVAETRWLLNAAKRRIEAADMPEDAQLWILSLIDHATDLFVAETAPGLYGLTAEQLEALISCAEVGHDGCPDGGMAANAGIALDRLREFVKYHWKR